MTRPFPFYRMMPKVASEGYCCIWGYLRLCRARGETKKQMAEWLGVSVNTLKNHYKRLNSGEHRCFGYSECLRPVIEDINPCPGDLSDNLNPPD